MAMKVVNFKMEEAEILNMKKVASVFNITVTDMIKEAVREYMDKLKKDPFYKLTMNVEDASPEETAEILETLSGLNDEDLRIASSKTFSV